MQFTRESAERVANVVRTAEVTPSPASPLTFGNRFQQRSSRQVRLVSFTGQWNKDTFKIVSFADGTTTNAANVFYTVYPQSPQPTMCMVEKEPDGWYFVNAERGCASATLSKELDSSSSDQAVSGIVQGGGAEVLLSDGGCAKWYRLTKKDVVVDVRWENGIVVTKQGVWLFASTDVPQDTKIIDATDCEETPA